MINVKKILFVTLSNIGDVVLTLPVLDCLRYKFPAAKITVICGERAKEIFEGSPAIEKIVVFNKRSPLREKIKLSVALKKEKFDAVIDLRNSFFGRLIPAKYKIPLFLKMPKGLAHMKDRHLYKIQSTKFKIQKQEILDAPRVSLHWCREEENYIDKILKDNNISSNDRIAVIAPGARSHTKKWPKENFASLVFSLQKEPGVKIFLAGDKDDEPTARFIEENSAHTAINLCGKTSLRQISCLLKKAALLVTNDSAILHIGSYLNIPTVAVFGITSEKKYGPWPEIKAVIKREIFCRPCEKAQCRFGNLRCINLVKPENVFTAAKEILGRRQPDAGNKKDAFKRILVVRTDRIGDVVLSTSVLRALRRNYPYAYIAVMVGPNTKEIVEANPDIDEVIIYDKDFKHKSWYRSMKFASRLKKKHFDLALILHPTNRVHLIAYFAKIKRRVGYDRKMGFLLTDRVKHTKQKGEKHELEYNLDLLRYLGIEPQDKNIYLPLKREILRWADEFLLGKLIIAQDKLLGIHPAASCPSKIWQAERFAEVADKLADKYGFKILIFAGVKDVKLADALEKKIRNPVINLAGKISLAQLAAILKKCQLFISNDSGPVHIASAVGVPVISIFGRSQKGLSPKRWGPVGKYDKVLHKEIGCIECLAHNCIKEFACLKAITVEDVVRAADTILKDE